MDKTETLNHHISRIGWGVLLIWWGIVTIIDPLTISIGVAGTGLIFLGANAFRLWKGIPMKIENNVAGVLAIGWGSLDQIRRMLALPAGWSFALLLVVIGLAELFSPLLARSKSNPGDV